MGSDAILEMILYPGQLEVLILCYLGVLQGGVLAPAIMFVVSDSRGQWSVYYTSPQSFSYSMAQ